MSYLDDLLTLEQQGIILAHPSLYVYDNHLRLGRLKSVDRRTNRLEILEKVGAYLIQLKVHHAGGVIPIVLPYKGDDTLASLQKIHINPANTNDDLASMLYSYCQDPKTRDDPKHLNNLFYDEFPLAELPISGYFKLNLRTFIKNRSSYEGDIFKTIPFASEALSFSIKYDTSGKNVNSLRLVYWCHAKDHDPFCYDVDQYINNIFTHIGSPEKPIPLKPKYADPSGFFILSREQSHPASFGLINLVPTQARPYTQTRYLFPQGSVFAFDRSTLKRVSTANRWDQETTFQKLISCFIFPTKDDCNKLKYGGFVQYQ